jgi:hypothetical protein
MRPNLCFFRTLVVISAMVLGSTPARSADAPTLTRLFPPGGCRGEIVSVAIDGKFSRDSLDVWTNRPGLDWKLSEDGKTADVTIAADAEPGVIEVRIFDGGGASEILPFVVGHLAEIAESEPNSRVDQANVIESSTVVVNAALQDRGDVDHFRLSLKSGQTLVASVQAETPLRSPVDVTMQIVNDRGDILDQNLDYHGLDPQIVWAAEEASDVIVRVFGFPSDPNSTIGLAGDPKFIYRLTLTTGPFIEGVVPSVVSGQSATEISRVGWNLEDQQPRKIEANSQADRASYRFFESGAAGVYELPIVSIPIFHDLTLSDIDSAPMAIQIPAIICGRIETEGEVDQYRFAAQKDSQWAISIESRQLGYPLDPVVEIVEAESGKRLKQEDDSKREIDPTFRWKAPQDGEFIVRVSDLNGFAAANFIYRLAIENVNPDFQPTVADNRFRGKVGEALEIPIDVNREDGYQASIRFDVATPPEGVQVESAESQPEGDSAKKVMMKLTAAAPFNGPVQITAIADGSDGQDQRTVQAANQVTDIWITIE